MTRVTQPVVSIYMQKRLRYSWRLCVLAGVFAVMAALIAFSDQVDVRWFFTDHSRDLSLSAMALLIAAFVCPSSALIAYRRFSHESEYLTDVERILERGRNDWIGRFAVALVLSAGVAIGSACLFFLLEATFTNARITTLAAAILAMFYGAGVSFSIAYYVSGLESRHLLRLVGLVLGLGLLISFLIVQDREWWRNSISFLGHAPGSDLFFNLTIISVGLIALTMARDLLDDLWVITAASLFPWRSYRLLKYGLVLICVGVIGVGLFPIRISQLSNDLHNISAHGMAVLFIIGMLFINRIAPNIYPPVFVQLSRVMGIMAVAALLAYYLFAVINFVALELLLFALFALWIYLFKERTQAYIRQQDAAFINRAISYSYAPEAAGPV